MVRGGGEGLRAQSGGWQPPEQSTRGGSRQPAGREEAEQPRAQYDWGTPLGAAQRVVQA